MKDEKYTEFYDPQLVAIYDTVNPVVGYEGFYVELAKRLHTKSILDLGSGSGLLTCKLSEEGYQMIGVEPSPLLLNLARKRLYGERVRWIEGDVNNIENIQVDLAIMTGHVAQFFLKDEEWKNALEIIYKALRPGGHLAFESRNPNAPLFTGWPTQISHKKLRDPLAGNIEWWHEAVDKQNANVKYEIHYLFSDSNQELVSLDELIFRSKEEISQSLIEVGFSIENIFGDWDGQPTNEENPEMIFVAKKVPR